MRSDLFKGLCDKGSSRKISDEIVKFDNIILASDVEIFGVLDVIKMKPEVAMFMLGAFYFHRNDGRNFVLSLDEAISDLGSLFMGLNSDTFEDDEDLCSCLLEAEKGITDYYNDGYVFIVNPDWEERKE